MDSKKASETITSFVAQIPVVDRPKFTETIETDLLALHEGNFARYRIRPSEFREWKVLWNK
ncbi:MAG TPA: hypothetical protein VFX43_11395 [Chitinophagaceae bacterium]|nr:hypothetical protein [Chitinophagaceae bacterium]